MKERPFVVGVTGSLCAGKTTVTEMLSAMGYPAVYADVLGHYALTQPEVVEELTAAFGPGILSENGTVDRKALAALVFGDADALRTLNRVVHPRLFAVIEETLGRFGPRPVVLEAALLCEWGKRMPADIVVCVDAPEEVRRARCEGKYTPEEFTRRQESQFPPSEKRRLAHVVLINSGTPAALAEKTRRLAALIKKRFEGGAGLGGKIIL